MRGGAGNGEGECVAWWEDLFAPGGDEHHLAERDLEGGPEWLLLPPEEHLLNDDPPVLPSCRPFLS